MRYFEKLSMPLALSTAKNLVRYIKKNKIPIVDISSPQRAVITLKRSGMKVPSLDTLGKATKEESKKGKIIKERVSRMGILTGNKPIQKDFSKKVIVYNSKKKFPDLMSAFGHEMGHTVSSKGKKIIGSSRRGKTITKIQNEFTANKNFRDKILPKISKDKIKDSLEYQKAMEPAIQSYRNSLVAGKGRKVSKFDIKYAINSGKNKPGTSERVYRRNAFGE